MGTGRVRLMQHAECNKVHVRLGGARLPLADAKKRGAGMARIRGLLLLAAIAAVSSIAPAVHAATTTIDAPTFASSHDYCGSGAVAVSGTLRVLRGTGAFPGACSVTLNPGATLSIEYATLRGSAGGFSVVGGASSTASLSFSTINVSGPISIAPATTSDGGTATLDHSTLQSAQAIDVRPSCANNLGKATVTQSSLSPGNGKNVTIVASGDPAVSCSGGSGGKVTVQTSTVGTSSTPAGHLEIVTGASGHTILTGSTLHYATARVHSDGSCDSSSTNTPKTPCS